MEKGLTLVLNIHINIPIHIHINADTDINVNISIDVISNASGNIDANTGVNFFPEVPIIPQQLKKLSGEYETHSGTAKTRQVPEEQRCLRR